MQLCVYVCDKRSRHIQVHEQKQHRAGGTTQSSPELPGTSACPRSGPPRGPGTPADAPRRRHCRVAPASGRPEDSPGLPTPDPGTPALLESPRRSSPTVTTWAPARTVLTAHGPGRARAPPLRALFCARRLLRPARGPRARTTGQRDSPQRPLLISPRSGLGPLGTRRV
ncbi:translation initiation factor IF-2-like [Rhinolophus ferrumequinum]|uniref:translation initiation factor IF-2-like n=1 Tax=Rhinolophus ferrumequinum TaxID=59479 RepID=UPI00140FCCBC|nr:translation initiation factor IF-2-like [Rhinolophus ferrumequinum]